MFVLGWVGAGCRDATSPASDGSGGTGESDSEESGPGESGDAEASTASDETGASESGGTMCEETPPQTAGPFPQAGLERTQLDLYGHAGVPLTLRGRVLDQDCVPIPDAQILLWHATPSAPGVMPATLEADPNYVSSVYDHEAQSGAEGPGGESIPTGQQMYYGWTTTDAEGGYEFQTLRPGWYLNGASYRPAHLHVRIFVGGTLLLTSQLYFPDDPYNGADAILGAACEGDACFIVYETDDASEASFDLHVVT